jgi:hypothetical protein
MRKFVVWGAFIVLVTGLIGVGVSSAGAKKVATKVQQPNSVPFGIHVSVGCDTAHGVLVYVADVNRDMAVAYTGCTGPDLQSRVRVRLDNARGVLLYQLHRDANVSGPIRALDALPLAWTQV